MRAIAKAGAKAAILQGIEADQKAEAEAETARLLSLAKAKGFDTWEAAQQAEEAEAERKQAEVEAILDRGPDPDLPPASEPPSEAFHVATFEKAIDMLRSVETKPASMFGSAEISPNDIEQITAFLQEVAEQIAEKRRPLVALKRRSGSMCFCASPLGLAGLAAIRGLRCFGRHLVSALIVPSKSKPSTGLHSDCCAGLKESSESRLGPQHRS